MAKKSTTSSLKAAIQSPTKVQPIWQIGILFPDGKKITKPRCTLNDVFDTYFINYDSLVKPEMSAEEILEKYQNTFKEKGIKVAINYIDSWSHKWSGKVAWPKRDKFIEYLNNRKND